MAVDREEAPAQQIRRTRFSRRAGGFSSNENQGTTYGAEVDQEDEVLDPLSPEVVAAQIQAAPPPALREEQPERMSAQRRAAEVMMMNDAAYVEEHRLEFVARMLQRKVSLDLIARELNVSLSTIQRDRAKLKQMARDRARTMDVDELIGTNLALYDEIRSQALRIASDNTTPTPMKLAALRTSLSAESDRMRSLEAAGVLDVLRFRKGDSSENVSDIQRLMQSTERIFEARAREDKEQAAKANRPRLSRGFKPMTLADGDEPEVMEI